MGPYDKPFSPQEYLMHYGVKGMKWGVRRYQNKDGTLTKAGKERYLTCEQRTLYTQFTISRQGADPKRRPNVMSKQKPK